MIGNLELLWALRGRMAIGDELEFPWSAGNATDYEKFKNVQIKGAMRGEIAQKEAYFVHEASGEAPGAVRGSEKVGKLCTGSEWH